MSQDQDWYGTLSEAARSCGVDLSFMNSESVRNHEAEIASWVGQNLNHANLLTREELQILQFIERSKGQLHLDKEIDQTLRTPLHEKDLQDIVSGLQAQTRSIRARSQTLKNQKSFVTAYSDVYDNGFLQDTLLEKPIGKQQEQERQQIFFMNEENRSYLRDKTRLNHESLEKCLRIIDTTVREKLRTDDRILDSLETLTSSTSLQSFADQVASRSKIEILQRAIILSLKTRLDRVYMTELAKNVHSAHSGTSDDLEQTQNDLRSLYTEIEAVASMLVQNEIGSSLEAIEGELVLLIDQVAAQDALKITENLANLTESTQKLATGYRLLQACRVVFDEIDQLYIQAQTQTHATEISWQGFERASSNAVPIALLRHLGIDNKDTVNSTDQTKQLQEMSTSVSDSDRLAVSRITADAKVSIHQIHRQLQEFFENSRDDLSNTVVHNRDLDERIALAKTKLETASKGSETGVDARRRFVNAYLRA